MGESRQEDAGVSRVQGSPEKALMSKCYDCRRPATFGVRCTEHAERHRQVNRQRSRKKNGATLEYAPRRCRSCGLVGHDRRVCQKLNNIGDKSGEGKVNHHDEPREREEDHER